MSYDYRMVYTKMWREDAWFAELDVEGKLFWLYLLTNSSANASGVYQLRASVAATEIGFTRERCEALLEQFAKAGKIRREGDTLWIVKMREYQTRGSRSPKLLTSIHASLRAVSDCRLKVEYAETYGESLVNLLQNPSSAERLLASPPPSPSPSAEPGADPSPSAPPKDKPATEFLQNPLSCTIDYLNNKNPPGGKYNPVAALARLFTSRFGDTYKPDYGRIGKIAQSMGGDYVAVAKLIWECPLPEGDPHNFLTRAATRSAVHRATNKSTQPPTAFATTEDDTDAFWRQHLQRQEPDNGSE